MEHHDDIMQKIPRDEITEIAGEFAKVASQAADFFFLAVIDLLAKSTVTRDFCLHDQYLSFLIIMILLANLS